MTNVAASRSLSCQDVQHKAARQCAVTMWAAISPTMYDGLRWGCSIALRRLAQCIPA